MDSPVVHDDTTDLRHLDQGSLAMAVTVGGSAASGLIFWFIAAQRLDAESVGQALGLFQALVFVHYLTQLGLPVVIAHYGRGDQATASWVHRQTVVARALATVVVTLAVVGLMWRAEVFAPLHGRRWVGAIALFLVIAVATGLGTLAEARLVTLRWWRIVIGRQLVPAIARLPVVAVVSSTISGNALFLVAAAPPAVVGLAISGWLLLGVDRSSTTPPTIGRVDLRRYAAANGASMLLVDGPIFAAPLVVAATITADETAPFLVAWSIATVAFVLPAMLGHVLVSESSRSQDLHAAARRAYVLSQAGTCVLTVGAWLIADTLAGFYGPDYAAMGALLPVLVGANIAWVVTAVTLSVERARGRSRAVVVLGVLFAATTLVPIVALTPSTGTTGAAWCWFVGNCLTAVYALTTTREIWLDRSGGA